MPIKNYTTKVPADRSVKEIQDSLAAHGATGVLMEYEKGTGRIKALKFVLILNEKDIVFRLPIDWRKFQAVLKEQGVKRCNDEDYCYRVAWRCVRDWVMIQMALCETEMAEIPQVFLPYAMPDGENTIYDKVKTGFLLTDGK